jgi:Carboxypeptidase regulatory-like domain
MKSYPSSNAVIRGSGEGRSGSGRQKSVHLNVQPRRAGLVSSFILVALCFSLLGLFSGSALKAQTVTGSVVGVVTDTSNAVIASVTVTLTNTGTAEQQTTETSANGAYQFLNVQPGNYQLVVEKAGFKRFVRDGIQVTVQGAVRVDVALAVGNVSESVTVTALTPLIDTQSASVSQVVEGRNVDELPLNGRNTMNLLATVAGVIPQGSSAGATGGNQAGGQFTNDFGWGNIQIGGGMAGEAGQYLDGVTLNDAWSNTIGIVPTQDSVQEFRVVSSEVPPDFGAFMGGAVSMTTRSGTNAFHGTAYEYLRNTVLDANFFFNNRNHLPRAVLEQNQFGVAGGGPIKRDKMFFFGSYEDFRLAQDIPITTTVPTDQMKQGIFTAPGIATIYNPFVAPAPTRPAFLNNTIPTGMLNPTSLALLSYYAEPTNTTVLANNYSTNGPTGSDQVEYVGRYDYTVNEKQRVFARYSYWNGNTQSYNPFFNKTGTSATIYHTDNATVGDTYSFSPKLLGDFRASYMRTIYSLLPASTGKADLAQYGPAWATLAPQLTYNENPVPSVAGFYGFGNEDTHNLAITNEYILSGSFTKILNRHTLKMGGEARREEFYFLQLTNSSGSFAFSSNFTNSTGLTSGSGGNAFASFLLGTPASGNIGTGVRTGIVNDYDGLYLNDTYQVTRKLTLNLGVRWEIPGMYSEKKNRLTELLPNATDPLSAETGLPLKGQLALVDSPAYTPRTIMDARLHYFDPRVGLAWQAPMGIVARAAYGISHQSLNGTFGAGSAITAATTTMVSSVNGAGIIPTNLISNPFPAGVIEPPLRSPSFLSTIEGNALSGPVPTQSMPYMQQWNLGFQKEIVTGLLFDIGYVGAKATHLPVAAENLNQLPDQYDSMGSALLNSNVNPFAGKVNSTSVLNGPTITTGQLLRPYPQFTSVTVTPPTYGNSEYDSLQAKVVKRFKTGGTLSGNYTWSKNIADADTGFGFLESNGVGAIQDYDNIRGSRSLTSFNVAQRVVVSYVADLPFGRGQRWGNDVTGVAGQIISGWRVNGISTFQSGFPLPLTASANSLSSFGAGTIRPNVAAGCNKKITGSAQSRLGEWFNTSCFSEPGAFAFGSEGRTDNTLVTPGIANYDFSTVKKTRITEGVNVDFDVEFFNIFNRVQFGPPGEAFNPSTISTPANVFGVISSQINQPRLVQFAARLNF